MGCVSGWCVCANIRFSFDRVTTSETLGRKNVATYHFVVRVLVSNGAVHHAFIRSWTSFLPATDIVGVFQRMECFRQRRFIVVTVLHAFCQHDSTTGGVFAHVVVVSWCKEQEYERVFVHHFGFSTVMLLCHFLGLVTHLVFHGWVQFAVFLGVVRFHRRSAFSNHWMGRGGTDNVMHFRANSADNFGVRDKTVVRKHFHETIFSFPAQEATVVVGRCRNALNMVNVRDPIAQSQFQFFTFRLFWRKVTRGQPKSPRW